MGGRRKLKRLWPVWDGGSLGRDEAKVRGDQRHGGDIKFRERAQPKARASAGRRGQTRAATCGGGRENSAE